MKINNFDTNLNTYVFAEVGGNHNGNPEIAMELVEAAAETGANAVKFQSYKAELLVHPKQEPLPIVRKYYKNQLDRFKSLELSDNNYQELIDRCKKLNIDFLTTPFDLQILDKFSVNMPVIKIASGDLTYHKLIKHASLLNKPVILSTGMSNIDEIDAAVHLVPKNQLSIMHCVSLYPLPDDEVNLKAITVMKKRWPTATIGYSDHTIGLEACLSAVALGARIIEKHFTLDCTQKPGDHILSLEPELMRNMISSIRRIDKMLGSEEKKPRDNERKMKKWMRRGVYAARNLRPGQTISENDIIYIRPTTKLSPSEGELLIGKRVKLNINKMQELKESFFC